MLKKVLVLLAGGAAISSQVANAQEPDEKPWITVDKYDVKFRCPNRWYTKETAKYCKVYLNTEDYRHLLMQKTKPTTERPLHKKDWDPSIGKNGLFPTPPKPKKTAPVPGRAAPTDQENKFTKLEVKEFAEKVLHLLQEPYTAENRGRPINPLPGAKAVGTSMEAGNSDVIERPNHGLAQAVRCSKSVLDVITALRTVESRGWSHWIKDHDTPLFRKKCQLAMMYYRTGRLGEGDANANEAGSAEHFKKAAAHFDWPNVREGTKQLSLQKFVNAYQYSTDKNADEEKIFGILQMSHRLDLRRLLTAFNQKMVQFELLRFIIPEKWLHLHEFILTIKPKYEEWGPKLQIFQHLIPETHTTIVNELYEKSGEYLRATFDRDVQHLPEFDEWKQTLGKPQEVKTWETWIKAGNTDWNQKMTQLGVTKGDKRRETPSLGYYFYWVNVQNNGQNYNKFAYLSMHPEECVKAVYAVKDYDPHAKESTKKM